MRVLLTGATGLIGLPLVARLAGRGDVPVVVSRDAGRAAARLGGGTEIIEGDPAQPGRWMSAVDGCDAVVNLAGENLFARRWSARQKQWLRDSRVRSTEHVVAAIERAARRPRVLVSASAVGYYGDVPEGELDESSPPGGDFLARACVDWEQAARRAEALGVRTAIVRVGVVLSAEGGALAKLLLPFRLGVGGPVGRGRQWVSWIHLDDIVGALLAAVDRDEARGPINGTAPQPVRNKEFSRALARALRRPSLLPVPPPALRLLLGEVAGVVIGGQRVLPTRLSAVGYEFRYRTCDAAMESLLARRG
jgi:hypothetical protein